MPGSLISTKPGRDGGVLTDGAIALQAGFVLVVMLFFIALFADILFLFAVPLNPVTVWLVLIAAVAASGIAAIAFHRQGAPAAIGIAAAIALACLLISKFTVDTSYDGQEYHFLAIYALTHGWNPVTGTFGQHLASWMQDVEFPQFYAKAGWVIAAVQVMAGASFETARSASLILPAAGLLACFGILRQFGLGWKICALLAGLIAANPIVLQELILRMNDGQVSALIAIVIAGAALAILKSDRRGWWIALPALALTLNLKTSGLPIMVVLCAALVALAWFHGGWRRARDVGLILAAAGIAAILLIGYSPYIRNTVEHGYPWYPLDSASWSGMMAGDIPPDLERASPAMRLFLSYAAPSGYLDVRPKLPFTIIRHEIRDAGDVEVMVGGLGPFFSGALLLAAAILVALALCWRRVSPLQAALLIVAAGLLCAVLPMPESWYARYVPHMWFVPIVLAMAALAARDGRIRLLGMACIAALCADVLLVAYAALWQDISFNRLVAAEVQRLRQAGGHYCADLAVAPARASYFSDHGLDVRYLSGPPPPTCPALQPLILTSLHGTICRCR